jgi:ribosomal protein S27E
VPDIREPAASEKTSEPEVARATRKFECPACGGEAQWNPAKRALICPYCGTESPAELEERDDTTVIVEHDLAAALRALPDSARGWNADRISVRCQSCHAISVFDPGRISERCQFCGSTALVPYEEVKASIRPESLLPITVAEGDARDLIRAWYGRQWLAPNGFAGKALTDTVKGIYLPYWTFDAHVDAHWTADSGTYYYTGSGKNRRRQVRWTPAAGDLSHDFDDELVCASLGVRQPLLRKVEPFPTTNALIPYDAGYLSGWTVERYQIDLVTSAQRSRERMEATIRQMCARAIPGDTYRDLVVHSQFSGQTFKHVLLPVWLVSYAYKGTSYQVVVNGATGSVAGERPWSWIKIGLLVVLGLIVFMMLQYLQN